MYRQAKKMVITVYLHITWGKIVIENKKKREKYFLRKYCTTRLTQYKWVIDSSKILPSSYSKVSLLNKRANCHAS